MGMTPERLEQEVARLKAALSWIDDTPHGNKMLIQGEVALDNILEYIKELESDAAATF